MKTPTLFEYDRCDTCRKAKKWLAANDVEVETRPIVERPPTVDELRELWRRSGLPLKKFFNTSGQSYRALPIRERLGELSDDALLRLLAADGKLIKRPLLDAGRRVLVGFDERAWSETLNG